MIPAPSLPASSIPAPGKTLLRQVGGIAAYLALYLVLDWISLIEPVGALGITPWNPPAGLSFALLLRYGLRFVPAVFAAVVIADELFRGVGQSPLATGSSALVIAAGYGAAGTVLREYLRFSPRLNRHNDLISLFSVTVLAAFIIAATVVAIFAAAGLMPWDDFGPVALRFWVGDVIGIAVLTPFLLLLFDSRTGELALPGSRAATEYGLQLAAIALGLWIIFGIESADHFEFSYALFLPLTWIALRGGLKGATWGIVATQLGLVLAIHLRYHESDVVVQFQLLMLAVTVTGLLLGAAVDERRRAESSLRDSETRLQTVLRTAPDAIVTFLETGAILSANPAAEAMFGLGGGARAANLSTLLPEIDLARLRPATQSEMMAYRPDGSSFAADVALGQSVSAGQPLYVAAVRDISARKQAEGRLKQREAELAHAARLATSGEMAAALAHELNQPLTALVSFARACQTILRDQPADAATRQAVHELIDQAVQQALRAGDIIRSTREFIRRGDVYGRRIEIAPIFDEVLTLARSQAAQDRIELQVHVDADLPAVFADPIQIEQVILNLVRNSTDAIARDDSTRRQIALSASRSAGDPGSVEIAVRDTGPGFSPEIAGRLFRPFATTTESGMGLGLSISRSIVEAHGGRIWAEAAMPGYGADIRFTIPIYSDGIHGA